MTVSRAVRKAISRSLIGVLLFAQFSIAGYACPGLLGTSARSMSDHATVMVSEAASDASVAAQAIEMAPGCDQMDQDAANLCLEHCRHGQQSADTAPAPVVFSAIPTLLYSLPFGALRELGSGRPAPALDVSLAAAPPPPHSILHCVFRI